MTRRLLERFRDARYRHAYAESFLDSSIAVQIKTLREQREWTQKQLAEIAKMKQSRISALEDVNYSSWSMATLKRLARAFGVAPVFVFETFEALASRAGELNRDALEREPFDGVALQHTQVQGATFEVVFIDPPEQSLRRIQYTLAARAIATSDAKPSARVYQFPLRSQADNDSKERANAGH